MTQFAGRVESRFTVPSGGAAVSATIPNGLGATTITVPSANYFHTSAGGVSSLLTTFQTQLNTMQGYPTTAAATNLAINTGTWSAGWLFNITSGNDTGAFGGITMTASGSPTYSNAGPLGGTDLAVGFNSSTDLFSAGDVLDAIATDDLAIAWVAKVSTHGGTDEYLFSKRSGNTGWVVYLNSTTSLRFNVGDGVDTLEAVVTIPAGVWHAGIAVFDRSTNRIRVGVCQLGGSPTVSAEGNATAVGTMDNAANLSVGHASLAPTGTVVSAFYIAKGVGAATGLSAGLSTALTKFANAISAAWTVTLDTTSTSPGRVSIGWTGYTTPTWSLSWTSTDLRDLLGFTANISGATTTQTASKHARALWFPDCPLSIESDPDQAPRVTDLRTSMSPTGNVLGLVGNTMYRHRGVLWSHVPKDRTWESAVTLSNASWETFCKDAILGLGHAWMSPSSQLQIYYDRAGTQIAIGNTYNSSAGIPGWSVVSLSSIEPKPAIAQYAGLFRVELGDIVSAG